LARQNEARFVTELVRLQMAPKRQDEPHPPAPER